MDAATVSRIAQRVLDAFDNAQPLTPLTEEYPDLDLPAAYAVAHRIRELRRARGERVSGRKLGFTNRNIWPQYDVYTPIWGYTWDHSVRYAGGEEYSFSLARRLEPLIEPEIVFGLRRDLPRDVRSPEAMLDAMEWYAHAFEIVDTLFPAWKFQAPDTVADMGLHAGLVIGERIAIDHSRAAELVGALAQFTVDLHCDGERVAQGGGANVLDSPLAAIAHYLASLDAQPPAPLPGAGEVITTGTLTSALPVHAGQTWTVRAYGIDIKPVSIRFLP